jgi:glucosamine kinase
MSSLLLVESGSTKTDWCLMEKGKKTLHLKTTGINPYLQSRDEILDLLKTELKWNTNKHKADAIAYYGAGTVFKVKKDVLTGVLKDFFGTKDIEVNSDMMAAARAMCGNEKGIVCILGTGSNSCYYDGQKIKERQASLGFIAGDEGGGNYLGKKVLQYYAYKIFDDELMASFEQHLGNDLAVILNKIYREPFANRYLASFVTILKENRGHFMVENIVEDCLSDFFTTHLFKYRQTWKYPIHFTGSVAYEFKDVIQSLCDQFEMECGEFEKGPMKRLMKYHETAL